MMNKKWKTFAVAVLSLVAAVCLGLFVGCQTKPENVTYTFEVKYESGKSASGVYVIVCEGDACDAPLVTDSTGSVQVTKPDGEYTAHITNLPAGYTNDEEFTLTKDKTTYTFTLKEAFSEPTEGDGTAYNRYEVGVGTYLVTVNSADTKVYYSFYPPERAKYAIYSTGDCDTVVQGYYASSAFMIENAEMYNDDVSDSDKNFYLEFEPDPDSYQDDIYYRSVFSVQVKGANVTYPATFSLSFKKVGDATPIVVIPRVEYDGTNIPAYPEASANSVLTEAPYTTEAVFNEADGYYHMDSVNGPVLVAAINRGSRYSADSIAKMCESGESFSYQITENGSAKVLDFNSYLFEPVYDVQGNITGYNPCLIKSCNGDGVYAVTQEIYTMLQNFVKKHASWETVSSLPAAQRWLTFCYFYAEGTAESPFIADKTGTYSVKAEEGQTVYYTVKMFGSFELTLSSENIVCKKDNQVYASGDIIRASLADRVYATLLFSTKDGAAEEFSFTLTDYDGPEGSGTESDPYQISETGTYTARNVDGISYNVFAFQAVEAGTYKIVFTDGNGVAYGTTEAGITYQVDFETTVSEFELGSYQTFAFAVRFADAEAQKGSLSFRIEKVEEEG